MSGVWPSESPGRSSAPLWALLLVTAVLFGWSSSGWAHGNRPLAEELHAVGDDRSSWFLRTNFGAVTSDAPRRYVCEEAFTTAESFRFLPVAADVWLAASDGAIVRTKGGCEFEEVATVDGSIAAGAVAPVSRRVAVASLGDAGPSLLVGLGGGRNFAAAQVEFDSPPASWTGLAFASPTQLVATTAGVSDSASARLLRFSLPVEGAEAEKVADGTELTGSSALDGIFPELLMVDEELVVWTAENEEGANFVAFGPPSSPSRHRLDVEVRPAGAARHPETGKLWVASAWESDEEGAGRGFARIDPDTESPSLEKVLPDHSASCVERVGDDLFVCGHRLRDGYDVGRVSSDEEVETHLHFQNLEGPLSCPDDSDTGSVCPALWSEVAESLDIDPGTDRDAGNDVAEAAPQPGPACSTPADGRLPFDLVLGGCLLLAWSLSTTRTPLREGTDDV